MVWETYCQRSYVFEPTLSYNEAYSPVYYYLFARRGLSFCVPWYIEFSSVSDNPWKKGIDTCSRVGTVWREQPVKLEYTCTFFPSFSLSRRFSTSHFHPRKKWREITRSPRENRSWKIYNADRSTFLFPPNRSKEKKIHVRIRVY